MYAIRSYYEAVKCQITESDFRENAQALAYLGENAAGDIRLERRELGLIEKAVQTIQRHADEFVELRITSYNVCYTKLLRPRRVH